MLEKFFEPEKAKSFLLKYSFLADISIVDWVINDGLYGSNCKIINEWNNIISSLDVDFNSYLIDLVSFKNDDDNDNDNDNSIKAFVNEAYKLSMLFKFPTPIGESCLKIRGIGEKKCYEIDVMSKVIEKEALKNNIYDFVDVGAGRCYVSHRVLGLNDKIRIICIDNQKDQIDGAKKKIESDRILFINEDFTLFNGWKCKWNGEGKCEDPQTQYGIYSLHACGSLSDRMIESFIGDQSCKLLINIGCCYNLIKEDNKYSKEMKMMACQSPYKWKDDEKGSNLFLKRNFYRSLLQYMYDKSECSNDGREDRIGNGIGDQYLDSFSSYIEKASQNYVKRRNCKPPWSEVDLIKLYSEKKYLHKSLSLFWAMRAMLGIVIESLIIYDRYIFIKERISGDCEIIPIFDALKSPRSYAIIAKRRNNK